jgi:hypothetical protein
VKESRNSAGSITDHSNVSRIRTPLSDHLTGETHAGSNHNASTRPPPPGAASSALLVVSGFLNHNSTSSCSIKWEMYRYLERVIHRPFGYLFHIETLSKVDLWSQSFGNRLRCIKKESIARSIARLIDRRDLVNCLQVFPKQSLPLLVGTDVTDILFACDSPPERRHRPIRIIVDGGVGQPAFPLPISNKHVQYMRNGGARLSLPRSGPNGHRLSPATRYISLNLVPEAPFGVANRARTVVALRTANISSTERPIFLEGG